MDGIGCGPIPQFVERSPEILQHRVVDEFDRSARRQGGDKGRNSADGEAKTLVAVGPPRSSAGSLSVCSSIGAALADCAAFHHWRDVVNKAPGTLFRYCALRWTANCPPPGNQDSCWKSKDIDG
jgi:hypothetical protein